MRKTITISAARSLVAFLIISLFPLLVHAAGEYRMGAGDLVRIQVFEEDDLTIEARVGDTGTVAYPFFGEVQVSGKSARQLQDDITRQLKGDYLIKPVVTVSILEYRPFFVNGKVKKREDFLFSLV